MKWIPIYFDMICNRFTVFFLNYFVKVRDVCMHVVNGGT